MTFEEDEMDAAYKALESTEKFCETSKKFSDLFNSTQKLTPHQRLYRKSIVADCLLFEAILSITSYVKGGYLIRKAWKMYEKIFNETDQFVPILRQLPKPGTLRNSTNTSVLPSTTTRPCFPSRKKKEKKKKKNFAKKTLDILSSHWETPLPCSWDWEWPGRTMQWREMERERIQWFERAVH